MNPDEGAVLLAISDSTAPALFSTHYKIRLMNAVPPGSHMAGAFYDPIRRCTFFKFYHKDLPKTEPGEALPIWFLEIEAVPDDMKGEDQCPSTTS